MDYYDTTLDHMEVCRMLWDYALTWARIQQCEVYWVSHSSNRTPIASYFTIDVVWKAQQQHRLFTMCVSRAHQIPEFINNFLDRCIQDVKLNPELNCSSTANQNPCKYYLLPQVPLHLQY